MIDIVVNGEKKRVAEGTTVEALIAAFALSPHAVIVELSGAVVKKEVYDSTVLEPAARVELIQFVGGG